MFACRPLGATRDRLGQARAVQSQLAADLHPVNGDTGVLAHDHILITAQLDGFEVVGEDPFGDFLGLTLGSVPNRLDNIWRNFLERLNIQIAADVLDEAIKVIRDFHHVRG